jgi:hypothetical protein
MDKAVENLRKHLNIIRRGGDRVAKCQQRIRIISARKLTRNEREA